MPFLDGNEQENRGCSQSCACEGRSFDLSLYSGAIAPGVGTGPDRGHRSIVGADPFLQPERIRCQDHAMVMAQKREPVKPSLDFL